MATWASDERTVTFMMTAKERIEQKRAKIEVKRQRIATDQAAIAKLQREIEALESLEIKGMLKEIDMPIDQLRELLKTMKPTPKIEVGE